MDERREEREELATLAREDRDDAREQDDASVFWHEEAMDQWIAGCFLRINDA